MMAHTDAKWTQPPTLLMPLQWLRGVASAQWAGCPTKRHRATIPSTHTHTHTGWVCLSTLQQQQQHSQSIRCIARYFTHRLQNLVSSRHFIIRYYTAQAPFACRCGYVGVEKHSIMGCCSTYRSHHHHRAISFCSNSIERYAFIFIYLIAMMLMARSLKCFLFVLVVVYKRAYIIYL